MIRFRKKRALVGFTVIFVLATFIFSFILIKRKIHQNKIARCRLNKTRPIGVLFNKNIVSSKDQEILAKLESFLEYEELTIENGERFVPLQLESVTLISERLSNDLILATSCAKITISFPQIEDVELGVAGTILMELVRPEGEITYCAATGLTGDMTIATDHFKCQLMKKYPCYAFDWIGGIGKSVVATLNIIEFEYEIGGSQYRHERGEFHSKPHMVCP